MRNNKRTRIAQLTRYFLAITSLIIPTVKAEQIISLQQVLNSASQHYPKILEAKQKLQQAKAERLSTEGAFDIKLKQKAQVRTSGFYDGAYTNQSIVKPLRQANAKVFVEYRLSEGDFPVYEDQFVTQDRGEFGVGVSFSLLQNRDIDASRVAVANADLDLSMQAFNQQAVLNDVLFSASLAYMEWLSAMQQLDVYRQLLNNAKTRQTALEKRIKLGFSAKIDLLDNEQNVLKRQALVLKAENDLRMRTAALSLYWRDSSGKPKMVSSEQPTMPNTVAETALDNVTQLITHAITSHPDIQYVDNQILQHKNNRKLFENALLPKVDVVMKASRDFGSGSQTREGFETYVGLEFSMPLEQRKSKGKLNKTQAKLRELGYLRQRLIEELKLVLHQAKMKYTNAQAQATISLRRSDIATQLMQQEQERFNQGDSDIFKLNLREEDTAEAKIDAITAELQQILTHIELLGQAYKIDDLLPSFKN